MSQNERKKIRRNAVDGDWRVFYAADGRHHGWSGTTEEVRMSSFKILTTFHNVNCSVGCLHARSASPWGRRCSLVRVFFEDVKGRSRLVLPFWTRVYSFNVLDSHQIRDFPRVGGQTSRARVKQGAVLGRDQATRADSFLSPAFIRGKNTLHVHRGGESSHKHRGPQIQGPSPSQTTRVRDIA